VFVNTFGTVLFKTYVGGPIIHSRATALRSKGYNIKLPSTINSEHTHIHIYIYIGIFNIIITRIQEQLNII